MTFSRLLFKNDVYLLARNFNLKKKNITYLSVDCSCYLERNFVRLFKFGKRFMKFSDPVQSYQEKLLSQARRRYFEIT